MKSEVERNAIKSWWNASPRKKNWWKVKNRIRNCKAEEIDDVTERKLKYGCDLDFLYQMSFMCLNKNVKTK